MELVSADQKDGLADQLLEQACGERSRTVSGQDDSLRLLRNHGLGNGKTSFSLSKLNKYPLRFRKGQKH